MAYYALLAISVIVFAGGLFLTVKNTVNMFRIQKKQKAVLKENPDARRIYTEKGMLFLDGFLVLLLGFMGLLEGFRSSSQPDWSMLLLLFGLALAYLARTIKAASNGFIILGKHFFMVGDKECRYRYIREIENYRSHWYAHTNDGYIEMTARQAELVSEARKKTGALRKTKKSKEK